MSHEFTDDDKSIIANMMLTKTNGQIAAFMEVPVEDIWELVKELNPDGALITREMKLKAKRAGKTKVIRAVKPSPSQMAFRSAVLPHSKVVFPRKKREMVNIFKSDPVIKQKSAPAEKVPFVRPPAVYTNTNWEKWGDELLKREL